MTDYIKEAVELDGNDDADTINDGVWGSFAGEEKQHPQSRNWRRVERRCRKLANEVR